MGHSPRAAGLLVLALAVASALLLVGSAAASQRHTGHIGTATDACAAPSDQDLAESDFFWYWPCASFLHVVVNPGDESLGYVQSTPYAIDCPHACTRPFAAGTSVQLTAHPSNGGIFSGWSGACAGQGNPCTVTVNGDTQVEADFGGTVVPATNTPLVNLVIFYGNVGGNLIGGDDTYVFASPPGGPGGLSDAAGGTHTYSIPKGTSVTVSLSDDDGCWDEFHVNGSGSFGTFDIGTASTSYTFQLNASTVLGPYTFIC